MKYRWLQLLIATALVAHAEEKWVQIKSGPFEVLSNNGDKPAREAINSLEQLRYALGATISKQELKTVWPIRILLLKPGKTGTIHPQPKLARDAYLASTTAIGPETQEEVIRIFLDENAGRLPQTLEYGLVEFFSQMQADGTKVTGGLKVPRPTRDWSRIHMLMIDPAYSGKLRVLLFNLQQGVDADPAYRNAFEKTQAQVEQDLNNYIQAGKYETRFLPSRPIDVRRQVYAEPVAEELARLAEADVLYAHGDAYGRPAYEALQTTPAGAEGLAILSGKPMDAAVSARGYLEKGKREADPLKKQQAFAEAAKLNPKWADPLAEQAALEQVPVRKAALLKKAAELDPRRAGRWQAAALAQDQAGQFAEAAKSWGMAERATENGAERERIHQARLATEEQRVAKAQAEKDAERRKRDQELNDLRNRALAQIRAAEAKANAGQKELDKDVKVVEWDEVNKPTERTSGQLQRIECMGVRARLYLMLPDGRIVKFLVTDPGKVAIANGGVQDFACGPLKPARNVVIEYVRKKDKKVDTVGEVSTIEFSR